MHLAFFLRKIAFKEKYTEELLKIGGLTEILVEEKKNCHCTCKP